MATASKYANRGKKAEATVREWLDKTSNGSTKFAYHRFPDAKAAQGPLAAQPSDFLVVDDGAVIFLEVKESGELYRLPKDKVSQYGALKKFHWAGATVYVIVHRTFYNDWVVFDQLDLFPEGETLKSFEWPGPRATFPTATAALNAMF